MYLGYLNAVSFGIVHSLIHVLELLRKVCIALKCEWEQLFVQPSPIISTIKVREISASGQKYPFEQKLYLEEKNVLLENSKEQRIYHT